MPKEIESVLQGVRDGYMSVQEEVRGIFGSTVKIDEMALYLHSEKAMYRWLTALVREPGYEIFNSASDRVETRPIVSAYVAHYWFVRTPFPFRIEVMRIGAGNSPLHSPMISGLQSLAGDLSTDPFAVHASFKCADEEEYASAQVGLRANGFDLAQSCESAYGRFSYYTDGGGASEWYLKPRLNLRDKK